MRMVRPAVLGREIFLPVLGLAGALALLLRHSWHLNTEVLVSARELADFEARRKAASG